MKIEKHINHFKLIPETNEDHEFVQHWLLMRGLKWIGPNPQTDDYIIKVFDLNNPQTAKIERELDKP